MRLSRGLLVVAVVGLTYSVALAGDLKCHVTMGGAKMWRGRS